MTNDSDSAIDRYRLDNCNVVVQQQLVRIAQQAEDVGRAEAGLKVPAILRRSLVRHAARHG